MPENQKIPDLLLERFALGELPPEQMQAIREKLKSDPQSAQRLKELEESNQQILREYDVEEEVRTIKSKVHLRNVQENYGRQESRVSLWRRMPVLAPAAGLAVVLLLVFLPSLLQNISLIPQSEDNRIKGLGPRLQVFLKQDSMPVQLKDGDVARKGDILQLRYISAGKKYGMIFSIDGRGNFTLHFPEKPGLPLELKSKGKVSLKHAYELDDAPKFERFYFISSSQSFDARQILDVVQQSAQDSTDSGSAKLALPQQFHQEIVTLKKD